MFSFSKIEEELSFSTSRKFLKEMLPATPHLQPPQITKGKQRPEKTTTHKTKNATTKKHRKKKKDKRKDNAKTAHNGTNNGTYTKETHYNTCLNVREM